MRLLFVVVALVLSAAQAASAQVPAPGQCNADPTLSSDGLIVGSPLFTADQLRARLAREPGLAAQLDNPTVAGEFELLGRIFVLLGYPPLEDLDVLAEQVRAAHVFASVELNGRMCFTTPPPDRLAAVVDFYNTALDHYFYTADAGEIAAIESGAVGPGWTRTGETFDADVAPGCPSSIDTPVYRFAGTPGKGPSSHFFTRDRAECYVVKSSGQWTFEGLPFWAAPLGDDGTCTRIGTIALHRLWRPSGETNHRFTTKPAIVAQMVARGWVSEGPAMCVRRPASG